MWRWNERKTLLETIPFNVESVPKEGTHAHMRLVCPDWVNVLPITFDGQALLIKQQRAGTLGEILETPGGCVDAGEKDPTLTARRELEEETGFVSERLLPLAALNPNPALNTNICHHFLALGCQPAAKRQHFPDPGEDITLALFPVKDLENMVRWGQVNHALSALTIMLALKYLSAI